MLKIKRIFSYPLRRWRTCGYGIHSPFAYTLMTRVIGETTPFDCYRQLPARLHGERLRHVKLLIRIICHFRPTTIYYNGANDDIHAAIRCADSRIIITANPKKNAFAIVDSDTMPATMPATSVLVVLPPTKLPVALTSNAMTFTDGRVTIACRRADLPCQKFIFSLK